MKSLDAILSWFAVMSPDTDFRPMINEWTREVSKETDFRIEARCRKPMHSKPKAHTHNKKQAHARDALAAACHSLPRLVAGNLQ